MDENLVGYLLNALDPATQRMVEDRLHTDPEAARRLELLRRALAPLAADKDSIEPPAGLRHATLARVAEHRCRDLPYAPPPPPTRATIPIRSWWRMPDAIVAAAILLVALPLVPLVGYRIRHEYNVAACKNNLSGYHRALVVFADHHNGNLPRLKDEPPEHFAGIFVPILNDNRLLGKDVSIACPSNGRYPPTRHTVPELRDLYTRQRPEFDHEVRKLAGCYAYALGYRDGDRQLRGLCRGVDPDQCPVMADRPPFDQGGPTDVVQNSRNHGGRGQNVLYLGGHVTFSLSRHVGLENDDIYLNHQSKVDAGVHRRDTVLAPSAARVQPAVQWQNEP